MTITTANDDHIAALRRQLATVADPVARVPLLRQLGEALVLRSPAEAERLLSEAYRSALAHGIEKELGRACWFLCELRRNDGDIEGARHWAERLGDAGQRFDSAFLRGYHQYALGVTALSVGDHEAARLAHAQALRIWQEDGYRLGEISALNGLAAVAGKQGRTDDQLEILQQCMRVAEEIDAEQWRPWLAHALGGLLIELGRWEEAVQTFYRALAVSEQRGTLPLMSHAFIGLGEIFLLQGLLDRALAMFGRAAEAGRRRQTYPLTYRSAVAGAGETLLRQGSLAAAWSLLDEAATASLSVEGRATLTGIRCCQTEVALGRGMVRHAQELVAEALQIAEELSLTTETGEALRVKALVLAETGRFSEARAALDQALARLRGTQESYRLARVHRQFGRFLAARGEYLAAADHLQAAIRLLRRLAMVADAAETVHLLMTADLAQGSDAALLNALTTLSTLRLEPAMLIEHALSLTGEATNAVYGAVVAGDRVIATWGRPRAARGEERESLTLPVVFGKTPVGVVRLEHDRRSHVRSTRVSLEGVAGVLAVPLHRLGADESPAGAVEGLRFRGAVGRSPVYHSQLAEAARHAQRDGPLLIVGEAATGRRLLARAIHESGRRAGASFVVVHCNAVPDDLLGDELFGQSGDEAAGIEARSGRLAATAGGTMVLFEPNAGSGLWERLEQAVQTCGLDVRIIVVALDGEAVQRTARFLSDAPLLAVPPLRERRGDIAELAHHLLRAASEQFNRGVEELSSAAQARLEAYDWPGNVRELQQAVERAVALADDRVADVAQLPPEMRG